MHKLFLLEICVVIVLARTVLETEFVVPNARPVKICLR